MNPEPSHGSVVPSGEDNGDSKAFAGGI
jgi:hypothetical protein